MEDVYWLSTAHKWLLLLWGGGGIDKMEKGKENVFLTLMSTFDRMKR